MNESSGLLALALEVAKDAGAFLQNRPDGFTIETKSTAIDIATQMDRDAEEMIVSKILAARSDDGIIGEEGATRPSTSGLTWVIDPLDGTVNYLYGLPGWCVSIACKDSTGTVVGVVYAPTLEESTWWAVRGGGAFRNGDRIRVGSESELDRALIGTGFAYSLEVRKEQVRVINDLLPQCRDIRRLGAAAVDLCHVASGMLDAYFEVGLKEWDKAAGALIIEEAGGIVTGGESESSRLVAANPALHQRLTGFLSAYR
ncbi:MAG: inositol monophosphatase family protein [Actinomycetota bacterium]